MNLLYLFMWKCKTSSSKIHNKNSHGRNNEWKNRHTFAKEKCGEKRNYKRRQVGHGNWRWRCIVIRPEMQTTRLWPDTMQHVYCGCGRCNCIKFSTSFGYHMLQFFPNKYKQKILYCESLLQMYPPIITKFIRFVLFFVQI